MPAPEAGVNVEFWSRRPLLVAPLLLSQALLTIVKVFPADVLGYRVGIPRRGLYLSSVRKALERVARVESVVRA